MFDLTAIDAKLTSMMWRLGAMAGEGETAGGISVNDIVTNATSSEKMKASGGESLYNTTQNFGSLGYQIVFGIVSIGVLIAIVIKGFEFAMATAADRDEKKKSLARVAIGGLIVFSATGIALMLAKFGGNMFKS